MYCKKCNIEVHGDAHGRCPICNGPLDQTSELFHAESGNAIDWQKLKDLISDIDAPAKPTENLETEKEQEAPLDLEKAFSAEDTNLQNIAAVSAKRVEKSANDFTRTKEILDKTLKEFDPEPALQPGLNQDPKHGTLYNIFIVLGVLIIAGAAAYYFSFKEPEPAKQSFVLPTKKTPLMVPLAQTDKKNRILEPTVQAQKSADGRQPELDKKEASQTAAPPAHTEGTPSPATKENKPAEPAPAVAPVEEKPAQPPAEENKFIAPPQQEAVVNTARYCVNVATCKIKESAAAVIKDLQKKGYEPAVDTITVKDTTWYRVTLGHFQTQGEAQNYARELQGKENIKGFVVKKK